MSAQGRELTHGTTTRPEEVTTMFDRHCSACDKTQLIFPSQITAVTNTDEGILVSYTCWCGSAQTWLTGTHGHAGGRTLVAA
jgi:hypothetical protein